MSPTKPAAPRVEITSTQKTLRVPRKRIADLVRFVARAERRRVAEVDVAVVAGPEMAGLNRKYLRHAGVTDVLSFDLSGDPSEGLVAQIIVCADEAVAQARLRRCPPQRELLLYVVHGLLHLMGYDDADPVQAARMHAREENLLDRFRKARRARPRRA